MWPSRARGRSGERPLSRRRFLGWMAGLAASGSALPGMFGSRSPAASETLQDSGGGLRRDPRYPRRGFAPFPTYAQSRIYGVGTYGLPDGTLLRSALEQGVRLVDTSPDYRGGEAEDAVGWATEHFPEPCFVMTQLPVEDWRDRPSSTAFHRSLRRSLGRLRRGDVEALLVRNAEPGQLADPEFREFARDVRASGLVRYIGASGHGPDLEQVLELALEDDLIELILFGAHLAGFRQVPTLLGEARARGKILVAMKTREAALWNELPGWDAEAERRRHRPWDGRWNPRFSRSALDSAMESTPAGNAVVSLRSTNDISLLTGLP